MLNLIDVNLIYCFFNICIFYVCKTVHSNLCVQDEIIMNILKSNSKYYYVKRINKNVTLTQFVNKLWKHIFSVKLIFMMLF